MITVRPAHERGHEDYGWLDTRHTFSFGDYHDAQHMGFGALRVINEDRVAPERGFPPHPHRDMEILSYVLDGSLGHKDSMGNGSVIRVGEVQRMSAGTGVVHSEWNPSKEEPVHFLQIWLQPGQRGLAPGYEQKAFAEEQTRNRLCLLASPDGRDGSVTVHQDAELWLARLDPDREVSYDLAPGRRLWIHVARGAIGLEAPSDGGNLASLDGSMSGGGDGAGPTHPGTPPVALYQGDGAAVSDQPRLTLRASEPAEVLLFALG